jgi:hypothetical protein
MVKQETSMPMRLLIGGLAAAGCLLAAGNVLASDSQKIGKLAIQKGWLSDYRQGLAEARKTGRPLFVVFRCQP